MSKKLTPWFPLATHVPAREGVYECTTLGRLNCYAYWDGRRFCWLSWNVAGAYRARNLTGTGHLAKRWRGLASNPKPKGNK